MDGEFDGDLDDGTEPVVETGEATPPGEGAAAAAPAAGALSREEIQAMLTNQVEETVGPIRERLMSSEARRIALEAQIEDLRGRGETPDDEEKEDDAAFRARLNADPRGVIEQLINRLVEPRISQTTEELGRRTSLQQQLAQERTQAVKDFGLDLPENAAIMQRAGEIYQGKIASKLAYPGMIYEAAQLAWAEASRNGTLPKQPQGPKPKPRTVLRSVVPGTERRDEPAGADLSAQMTAEFSPSELATIQAECKRNKMPLDRWYKRFKEDKDNDPLFGLRTGS